MKRLHVIYGDEVCYDSLSSVLKDCTLPPKEAVIALKPNLVVAKPSESGATTDPALVDAVIRFLLENGYRNLKIIESSWVGDSTRRAFEVCGYTEISEKYGVPLIDLKQSKTTSVTVGDLSLEVCEEAINCDFIINMPVLKAHCQTRITCALKNLKGCIPDSEKRRFHMLGLHRPIAALNKAVKSHLTIVDGIIGDLTFEEGGTPVYMGRIIVGDDPVLIDTYAASLLGYGLDDIQYISLAYDLGVGSTDIANADIVEHNRLQPPRVVPSDKASRYSRYIEANSACSACYGSLMHALARYEENNGQLPRTVKLVIGQGFKDKKTPVDSGRGRRVIGIGRCTDFCSENVKGCPPTAASILEKLNETDRMLS